MAEIKAIYEESHEIYGTPKIVTKMRQKGDKVSGRTVGKYMREIGIQAYYEAVNFSVSMEEKSFW